MKTYISILVCVISASLFSCLNVDDIEAERREIAQEKKELKKLTDGYQIVINLSKMSFDTTFTWIVTDGKHSYIETTKGKYHKGEKIEDGKGNTCSIVRLNKMVIDTGYIYKTIDNKDSTCDMFNSNIKLIKGDYITQP